MSHPMKGQRKPFGCLLLQLSSQSKLLLCPLHSQSRLYPDKPLAALPVSSLQQFSITDPDSGAHSKRKGNGTHITGPQAGPEPTFPTPRCQQPGKKQDNQCADCWLKATTGMTQVKEPEVNTSPSDDSKILLNLTWYSIQNPPKSNLVTAAMINVQFLQIIAFLKSGWLISKSLGNQMLSNSTLLHVHS